MENAVERRIAIFTDTMEQCNTHPRLVEALRTSIATQRFVPDQAPVTPPAPRFCEDCSVIVTRRKSYEAARCYPGERVCVLNFASAGTPGGGVVKGCTAQEEDLCRTSTLYPCLIAPEVNLPFHQEHMRMIHDQRMDAFYNDDCILTPGVVVIKDDQDFPCPVPEEKWITVSVLTCAAPYLRFFPVMPTDEALYAVFVKRWRRILALAAVDGADVVVLGAFGCGAFGNNPELVSRAAAEVIPEFAHHFRRIEFAVYCSRNMRNYDVFADVLGEKA